jgi:hypothetical protein
VVSATLTNPVSTTSQLEIEMVVLDQTLHGTEKKDSIMPPLARYKDTTSNSDPIYKTFQRPV